MESGAALRAAAAAANAKAQSAEGLRAPRSEQDNDASVQARITNIAVSNNYC